MKIKNKVRAIFLLLLLFSIMGCIYNKKYKLNGTINEQFNEQQVTLFAFRGDTILRVDTTIVVAGYFSFIGPINLEGVGLLSIGNYPDTVVSQIVLLDEGTINVEMDSSRVSGSDLNELYQSYLDENKKLGDELQDLAQINEQATYIEPGSPKYEKLVEIGKYKVNFKKENIHNLVGQYFFEKEVGRYLAEEFAFPSTESCLDSAFYVIYNEADSAYQQREWVLEYIESIERKSALAKKQIERKGKKYTNFTLTDSIGRFQNISDYVGKSRFTMLEFWASWCGPCIASIPVLKETYEKYDRTYLEIIGISFDSSDTAWKNALNKTNVPWLQLLSDSHELEVKIMEAYSFKGIPFSVLIDKDGNIVNSGHSEQIVNFLSQFEE